jgi:soluble lytic murein transglycosylase-like protein
MALSGAFLVCVYVVVTWRQAEAKAESNEWRLGFSGETNLLRDSLEAARGELDLARTQLDRAKQIINFSARYKIGADMAASVFDIALAEGLEPELAFKMVRVESEFNERATSPVGAVGLTQLMPETANWFQPGVTRKQLYNREVNLRIGFRYLRTLIKENKGNVDRALLVYNRGPVAVNKALARGENPANGYERMVGYKGKGTVE